jgi:YD repeat-containing protein
MLISADRNSATTYDQTWSYDALGNMISVKTDGTTVNRTTNALNQVTAIAGQDSLAYDNAGNMTVDDQTPGGGISMVYVYDAWNRLVLVSDVAGHAIKAYTYDGLGRRIMLAIRC